MSVRIYYHDPVEVDSASSWTGLSAFGEQAERVNIGTVTEKRIVDLFDYARPDAIVTLDGHPVVALEQTRMNPSGHNIPQRFSFHLRAAELGVPSILYYPEYSRRTFSDPNIRRFQPRVPLAQARLSAAYGVPVLSVFWPTDPHTLLPSGNVVSHQQLASVIDVLISNVGSQSLLQLPEVQQALQDMDRAVRTVMGTYKNRQNASVRRFYPQGLPTAHLPNGQALDPPNKCVMWATQAYEAAVRARARHPVTALLPGRPHTLVFTGTANHSGNDSEHPWPGYLTLLDALYARTTDGRTVRDRDHNLVYELPIPAHLYASRANAKSPPTATYIVDNFADLIVLRDGLVMGRPQRSSAPASVL